MQTTFFHNTRRTGKFSVRLLLFRDVLLEALSTGIPEMCVLHKSAFHIFQYLCTIHYIVFATPHKKRNTFSLKRPVPRRVFLLTFLPSKLSPKKILNFFKKMFDKPIPMCYYIRVRGEQSRQNRIRPDGQAVKTTPSHGVNPGSIPGQVTKKQVEIHLLFYI